MIVKRNRAFQIGLGLLVTVVCLVVALWGIDWKEVKTSFGSANYASLPLLTGLLVAFYWLKAVRWQMLLRPMRRFRTRELVPAMMIGFMGNNVLPAHLGEFVRVWVFGRQTQLPKAAILSTVVLERVFDLVMVLALLGISLVMVPEMPQEVHAASWAVTGITVGGIALLLAYIRWTPRFMAAAKWLLNKLTFLPSRSRAAITRIMESGAEGLFSLKSGKLLVGITITSATKWLLQGAMIYVSLGSFGLMVAPSVALIVMGVTALGVALPSAPGFFGVIQLCFWITLEPLGLSQADVFAASVYYLLAQYIPVTLVGLFYLNGLHLRLGDIERGAEMANRPDA